MSTEQETKRKIILPVDGSEHCDRAFNWYNSHFRRVGDRLVLIHCVENPDLPTFSLSGGFNVPTEEWKRILTQAVETTRKIEEEYTLRCIQQKLQHEFRTVNTKNPGEGICVATRELGADMIVIGNRGLGTIRRTVLGSVSDYVLHHAGVPVTVIPPPDTKSTA